MKKKRRRFITTKIIALGFMIAALCGTALLLLPLARRPGVHVSFTDTVFTAMSAVCVTGLLTKPLVSTWSPFGQIVILALIQMGGLGIVTFTTVFMLLLRRRISLKERMLIRDAYNLDKIGGLIVMVRRIIRGTLIVEAAGAVLYMFVFVPKYGARGVWKSIFLSVSAFCNAGMDLLGENSLMDYTGNVLVNVTTMCLIVIAGIGFPVWWTMQAEAGKIRQGRGSGVPLHERIISSIRHLPLYVKIVLSSTLVLIFGGALLIFIIEFDNARTLGHLPLSKKILASIFQSVTTRTAGFAAISQTGLRKASALLCCVLMFIGGSPSGTAGGIKTTTIVILLCTVISILRERNETELFSRRVGGNTVRRAVAIFAVSFSVMLISLFLLCSVQPGGFVDCLYEVVSAIATVGLSRDFTGGLTTVGRWIIIFTMYLGRIGPISLALFFNSGQFINVIGYPEERVSVG
ncbi:MAG: potassium transporter KtrB [Lachnospiraceae bacterium]|nr:potassium transporter KtrB [Lachnospiraceae bacterium]